MSDTRQVISARITVGIDLGDRYSDFCFVDVGGVASGENLAVNSDLRVRSYQLLLPRLTASFAG